jgi:tetratricopeptide (TPR) repeat protein
MFGHLLQVKDSANNVVQIINAIGNAWPLFLIVILTVTFIIYRKKIGNYLLRFNKVSGKGPLIEVNLEKTQGSDTSSQLFDQTNEPSNESKTEDFKKEIPNVKEPGFFEIYMELTKSEVAKADIIFQQIQEKESDPVEKEKNYLLLLALKHLHSGTNKISELEKIAITSTNEEIKFRAYKYLGNCYLKAKDFVTAQANYEKAFSLASEEEEKSSIGLLIAQTLSESGKEIEAIEYLKNINPIFSSTTIKAKLFATIAKYYDNEHWIEKCLALELAVANDPNNTSNLFEAAYVYSNSEKRNSDKFAPLSLLHYKDAVSYQPDLAIAFNNMGVSYDDLSLANKSIEAFKKSIELKNTLALANLANRYISIGCLDEAQAMLNKVKDYENVHENIWSALKKIQDNLNEENEKEEKIMQDAKRTQIFLREFASLYFSNETITLHNIEGNWKVKGVNVEYNQLVNSDHFEFKWIESEKKFTIRLNAKKGSAIIGDGEYIKKGHYSADKLSVFAIVSKNSLKLLLYDNADSISFHFVMDKE